MTRPVLAALLAALAFAAPAHAAPPQISDPAGDWLVPSQDVVRVRLERATLDGRPALRAVLTLAATPDPTATYYARLTVGCEDWLLGNRWVTRPEPFLTRTGCAAQAMVEQPVFEPATMTTSGNDVAFVAALPAGTAGRRVDALGGHTSTGTPAGLVVNGFMVLNGDLAGGRVRHTL